MKQFFTRFSHYESLVLSQFQFFDLTHLLLRFVARDALRTSVVKVSTSPFAKLKNSKTENNQIQTAPTTEGEAGFTLFVVFDLTTTQIEGALFNSAEELLELFDTHRLFFLLNAPPTVWLEQVVIARSPTPTGCSFCCCFSSLNVCLLNSIFS